MNRRSFVLTTTTLMGGLPLAGFSFKKSPTAPVRFGIITDPHYADRAPAMNRYYKQSLGKVRECVDLMNSQGVEFLIEIGDLKDEGNPPTESTTLKFLETIEGELSRFSGPLYHVLGNHDMDSISKAQFLSRISNTGFPQASSYYSFQMGSFHFVVLDANFTRDGTAYDHGNFDWKDTHISAEQLGWLKKDLQQTRCPTIVFVHQQLDLPGFPDGHRIYCPDNAAEVRKILEDSGKVLIVFQGHYHPGSLHTINGIHYYTLKAVIEGSGPHENSYGIVEVDQDLNIQIKGYRKAVSEKFKGKKA